MNMRTSVLYGNDNDSRIAWDNLLAKRNAAKCAHDHYHATIWQPLGDELDRISPRPDLAFEIEARSGQVARYFVPANDLHVWDNHISPIFREKAAAVRESWLTHRATCEQLGWDEACDESERLCGVQCELEGKLILMPAPDVSALMWKLEHLFGPETRKEDDYCDAWCADWINAVMNDARRLMI